MGKDFQLTHEQFLNGNNFAPWYGRIKSALENRNLQKYIDVDIFTKLKEENLSKREYNIKLKRAIKKNSKAKSIIINNVTDQVYEFIKNMDSAHLIMKKLETLYKKDKAVTLQGWMDKINELKANKLNEIVGTLYKIMEIFKMMEGTASHIGESEKVKILYNSLPLYAKLFIHPTAKYTAKQFYDEVNEIVTFKVYAGDTPLFEDAISNMNNHSDNAIEHKKDIFYIEKNKNNKRRKIRNQEYCHICTRKGHSTLNCRFNGRTNARFTKEEIEEIEKKGTINFLCKDPIDVCEFSDNNEFLGSETESYSEEEEEEEKVIGFIDSENNNNNIENPTENDSFDFDFNNIQTLFENYDLQ